MLPLLLLLPLAHAAPRPALDNISFPDPSLTFDPHTRAWYAFATEANTHHVQAATSPTVHGPWSFLPSVDLLPSPGAWVNSTSPRVWAPDVQYLSETNSFVLYYSALSAHSRFHCVGAATSPNITGPFTPLSKPLICPIAEGGAIDAAGYVDEADGSRWIVYKVDGSALGPGGPCGNGEPPGEPTPLRLQRVDVGDGVTLVGEAVTILDRDPEVDGPLVEAPSLVRLRDGDAVRALGGGFVLFYSSHCFNSAEYDVKYAVAEGIDGPYERRGQLLGREAGSFGLERPGGATGVPGGGGLVLHAECEAGRCMYEADYVVEDGEIRIT
ncbi:Arabinanase/levansucrase/invertase [Parachaetomium inaequale]|uniref:Arabinanase/levansucrase/invertase n=1 Tax=Parachaetomium inaequale TaxID=2588326 RepID=A0AAN6PIW9_9PEZI|nr:Arabinanase/levansucrase/invertase [Parachaetomium inaequale]